MVRIESERSATRRATSFWLTCSCGWAPTDPALEVTDAFFEDAVYAREYVEARLASIFAGHVCKEQS